MGDARRHPGEGSIFQRASDGLWVGRVDLGWIGGKHVRRQVTAQTLRALRPKMARLKREVEAGVLGDAATLEQWLTYWLDEVASKRVRARTLAGYRGYVRTWLVPQLGKHRLDKLKPDHVRQLHAAMEAAGRSPATRLQAHAILSRALVVAERDGRIMRNPAGLVDRPSVTANHRKALTLAQAQRVIASLDTTTDAAGASRLLCALLLGIRQGEALGLRWEDVDLAGQRVHIRQAVQRQKGKGLVVVPLKSTTSRRDIPMLAPVHYALAEHAKAGTVGYVWGGAGPTAPERDYRAWKAALVAAGVCPADAALSAMPSLHAARSTTGSLLMAAGVPLKVIAEILGHAHTLVTEGYTQGNEAVHRAAMDALEAWIEPRTADDE